MSNPIINFRVSEYNLARALHTIRQLEPNYQITSISHLVKTCFFDYLAKMNLSRSAEVPPEVMAEIVNFLAGRSGQSSISLDDLIERQQEEELPKSKKSASDDQSTITSVNDFSPPDDWKNDKEE